MQNLTKIWVIRVFTKISIVRGGTIESLIALLAQSISDCVQQDSETRVNSAFGICFPLFDAYRD